MLKVVENISSNGVFHIVSPSNEKRTLCGRKYSGKNWEEPTTISEANIEKLRPLCMWCWTLYRHKRQVMDLKGGEQDG